MKSFILTLFLLFPIFLFSQKITEAQAIGYAEKLYQAEILSEFGRDELIKKIKSPSSSLDLYEGVSIGDGHYISYDSLRCHSILKFCFTAFLLEKGYRSGMQIMGKFQNLVREKLIEKYGSEDSIRNVMNEEVEKIQMELQSKMLKEIEESSVSKIEDKIPLEDSIPIGFSYYESDILPFGRGNKEEYKPLISPKRSVFGKTRTRTLNDILKIGLIDKKVYNDILPKIKSNELYLESLVLYNILKRTEHYDNFDANKAKQLAFLDTLQKYNVLKEENKKRFLATYKPYEIKSKFDILSICKDAIVFDLTKYSLNPKDYYPLIFKEIKKIIPQFDFKNLEIIISPKDEGETIREDLNLVFSLNEKTYQNSFLHKFSRKEKRENDIIDTIADVGWSFHKGINKYLKDINSDKQLYFVRNIVEGTGYSLGKEFGLILMTKQQRELWDLEMSMFSTENHDNTFNTEGVIKIIKDFESIGLFKHLTKSEIDSAKMKIEEAEIVSYHDILLCFPKNIVFFDWEANNLENPYEALTLAFGAASRGAFTPINIEDTFQKSMDNNKPTCHFGFTFSGKRYKNDLQMNSDWLDPQFQELIEEAMLEQGVDGKIYNCMDGGQAAGYIFLNKVQHGFLTKNYPKFFPSRD